MELSSNSAPDIPQVTYTTPSNKNKLFSIKNIILLNLLLIMVVALPVGVYLARNTQIFKSKAILNVRSGFIMDASTVSEDIATSSEAAPKYFSNKKGEIVLELDSAKLTAETIFGVSQPIATPVASAAPIPTPISTPTNNDE